MILNDQYCKLPLKIVIEFFEHFNYDAFIKLSEDKVVKVSKKDDSSVAIFEKYQGKGISELYLKKEDFVSYLTLIKSKLQAVNISQDEPAIDLNAYHQIIKVMFNKIAVDENAIEMAKNFVDKSLKVINKFKSLSKIYLEFKQNSEEEFLLSILSSYTATLMVNTFNWQSAAIKQKVSMAALLADITLEENDFKIIDSTNNPKYLPERVFRHPRIIVDLLSKLPHFVGQETLTVIEQHHELPDGSGFPGGMEYNTISQLSCIYIVAYKFSRFMKKHDFKSEYVEEIEMELKRNFYKGNFKKATDALLEAIKQ